MLHSHDALLRRHRMRPVTTGKRVTLQPRDWLWLQKVHEHGPLPSSMLHAFSSHLCRSEKRARDRLTDLFNEDHTPHRGTYLSRPWQQFDTVDARYQELVHDLAPAGERALKERELWHKNAGGASGPWKHRYMVAAITASIELATLGRNDVSYIPQHAILNRAGTTLRNPVSFQNQKTGRTETRDLIPDALFGLEYRKGQERSYRFFVVEADRGTEPTRASRFNRKSHLRTFLQYRQYVGMGLYKDHLDLTAGLIVLNVATHETTLKSMLDLVDEIYPRGCTYQWFRVAEGFGREFSPRTDILDQMQNGWLRAGHLDMDLF